MAERRPYIAETTLEPGTAVVQGSAENKVRSPVAGGAFIGVYSYEGRPAKEAGDHVGIVIGGAARVLAGGNVTAGSFAAMKPDGSGSFVNTDGVGGFCGIFLHSGSAGEYVDMFVEHGAAGGGSGSGGGEPDTSLWTAFPDLRFTWNRGITGDIATESEYRDKVKGKGYQSGDFLRVGDHAIDTAGRRAVVVSVNASGTASGLVLDPQWSEVTDTRRAIWILGDGSLQSAVGGVKVYDNAWGTSFTNAPISFVTTGGAAPAFPKIGDTVIDAAGRVGTPTISTAPVAGPPARPARLTVTTILVPAPALTSIIFKATSWYPIDMVGAHQSIMECLVKTAVATPPATLADFAALLTSLGRTSESAALPVTVHGETNNADEAAPAVLGIYAPTATTIKIRHCAYTYNTVNIKNADMGEYTHIQTAGII